MLGKGQKAYLQKAAEQSAEDMVAGKSFWSHALKRFLRNKAALTSLFLIVFVIFFAFSGDILAQWSNEEIDWDILGDVDTRGGPSLENGHYFGVDEQGRDLFARVLQGSRVSLSVAFIAALLSICIGALLGAISGYFGGRVDAVILSLSEITGSIPYIIFFVVWQAFFGRGLFHLLLVMTLINWTAGYLIVRGQVMTLKRLEFIDAARLSGARHLSIISRHLLPNCLGLIVINGSLTIPGLIMAESLISFLGVGIQEPDTSWGALISEGAQTLQYGTTWQLFFPALFFVVTQVSLFYIGDGLRDALDPKGDHT